MNNLNQNIYFLDHRRSYIFESKENSLFSLNNTQSFYLEIKDFKKKKNWNTGFSFNYFLKNFKRFGLKYPYPNKIQANTGFSLFQSLKCLYLPNRRRKLFGNGWGYVMSPRRGGSIVNTLGFIGFLPKTHGLHLYFNYHFLHKKNYSLFKTLNSTCNLWAPIMFPCYLLSALQENPLRRNVKLLRFKYIFTAHSKFFLSKVEKEIDFIQSLNKKSLQNKVSSDSRLRQTKTNKLNKNDTNKKKYKN